GLRGHKASANRIVVVGEYGGVFVSTDRAASWTATKVDTEVCLFAVAEDAIGGIWIAGDEGYVARSHDGGKSFTRIRGLKTRITDIIPHKDRLLFLGHDGTM